MWRKPPDFGGFLKLRLPKPIVARVPVGLDMYIMTDNDPILKTKPLWANAWRHSLITLNPSYRASRKVERRFADPPQTDLRWRPNFGEGVGKRYFRFLSCNTIEIQSYINGQTSQIFAFVKRFHQKAEQTFRRKFWVR